MFKVDFTKLLKLLGSLSHQTLLLLISVMALAVALVVVVKGL
jgi:hypothetical protein